MNVWIWGPPLWDTLQSSAFLCDSYKISPVHLLKPLKQLLPCIFCRTSYATFYEESGDPTLGSAALYVSNVHQKVNRKLATQRIDAFIEKHSEWPQENKDFYRAASLEMFSDTTITPYIKPSLEVLKKRFLVNREECIAWRNLSTSLLAIVMYLEEAKSHRAEFDTFIKALRSVVIVSKQYNSKSILLVLDTILQKTTYEEIRMILENAKYSPIMPAVYADVKMITNLVKAGACIENTCT